uniref:IP05532p n=1 Tax=Drosophila melanogaster TaxID=7227 RepID=Q29QK4_DROME|nr:IP05532p [Drosophila melanogaster]
MGFKGKYSIDSILMVHWIGGLWDPMKRRGFSGSKTSS